MSNTDMSEESESTVETLAPDDAFAALGNETRVRILRVLGESDDPLSFSALYDEIDLRDSGQFNYHLEKLTDHFVAKTDDGYTLDRAGRRVVEAILSGAVTDDVSLQRTAIDEKCDICGASVEVNWNDGGVSLYCTECDGRYEYHRGQDKETAEGYLGSLPLPPAGLRDRSAEAASQAAWTWTNLEILGMASGLCPRCSARIERIPTICRDHDDSEPCSQCGSRYAARVNFECTNCIFETGGAGMLAVLSDTSLLDFLTDHGYNPVDPDSLRDVNAVQMNYEETVTRRDPFALDLTFRADDETLTLTVDENLSVVDAVRDRIP